MKFVSVHTDRTGIDTDSNKRVILNEVGRPSAAGRRGDATEGKNPENHGSVYAAKDLLDYSSLCSSE